MTHKVQRLRGELRDAGSRVTTGNLRVKDEATYRSHKERTSVFRKASRCKGKLWKEKQLRPLKITDQQPGDMASASPGEASKLHSVVTDEAPRRLSDQPSRVTTEPKSRIATEQPPIDSMSLSGQTKPQELMDLIWKFKKMTSFLHIML
ncbi:hypothetical protein Bca4012_026663 [Brassica carinata]